jgi:hypothetical protein
MFKGPVHMAGERRKKTHRAVRNQIIRPRLIVQSCLPRRSTPERSLEWSATSELKVRAEAA